MVAAGGAAGSLLAAPTSDWLGRKWSVFLWGLVFMVGAAMQMVPNYDVLLAGRFIGGLGVGASSMLSPQFLAENSPKSVRGSMTATYNLMIVTSLMLAFWVNYAVSLWSRPNIEDDRTQWQTAMSIQLIPGGMMCLMIPFVPETARYLINHGKPEQGLKNLCRLRKLPPDHPYIQVEYREIQAQVQYEQETFEGHNYWVVVKDIFGNRSNLQRFVLAVLLFIFHKLTGTDSLNVCPLLCLCYSLLIDRVVLRTSNLRAHRCERRLVAIDNRCLRRRQSRCYNLLHYIPCRPRRPSPSTAHWCHHPGYRHALSRSVSALCGRR